MLLDNLLDPLLLEVLLQVILHEELHGGTSTETGTLGVFGDGESSTGSRLPNVLFVVVVLGGDLDLLGNEVRRVETNTELTCRLVMAQQRSEDDIPIMEISAPEDKASMKALVPDLAIVPKLLTKSALVIPTPVSRIVKVPSSLLGVILTNNSFSVSRAEESVKAW